MRPWMRGLRLDEKLLLGMLLVSVLLCLSSGTGFTFLSVFGKYAEFFAIHYMLIFMLSRLSFAVADRLRARGRIGSALKARLAPDSDPASVLATDHELVRGGLTFLLAITAYSNIKERIPIINPIIGDGAFAEMDRALFGSDFLWVAEWVRNNPGADAFFQRIYLHDYVFIGAAALLMHLARDASGLRLLFFASSVCYLLGIWITAAWPSYGPWLIEKARWAWLEEHTMGRFQRTLAQGIARAVHASEQGTTLHARAFSGTAAFPSLHVGHMTLVGLICVRRSAVRWIGWVILVAAALTVVPTVAYGWHYFVDAPGGVLLAYASLWIAYLVLERERDVKDASQSLASADAASP